MVHSTGQLRDKYGEHGAATVWSTAGTKVFLPGIHDTATLEDVSKLCGTLGDGDADHARRVMPPELLARLPGLARPGRGWQPVPGRDQVPAIVAAHRSPPRPRTQAAPRLRLPARRSAGTAAGHHRPRQPPRRTGRCARRGGP